MLVFLDTPPKIPTTYENPFVLNESVTFAKVFENVSSILNS